MKQYPWFLFATIILMTSCKANVPSDIDSSISQEVSSKTDSSKEDISYSAYADDIVFYDDYNDGTCRADGSFIDPEIKEIKVPDTSMSGKKVTAVSSFDHLENLEKICLPKTVETIEDSAFLYDYSLKEINLPDSLMHICRFAFGDCTELKEINLPSSLETIEDSAFESCTSIEEVNIPEKIRKLPDYLFSSCSNLKKVNLPDELESIGIDTFGFTDIQNIFIPKSVTRLSAAAFRNDYGKMLNIYVEADSHPKTWELKSNDERCHFIYNARRSDFPE